MTTKYLGHTATKAKADLDALWDAIGGVYPVQPGEVGVSELSYPIGDIRRHGAIGDGIADSTSAWLNAILSALALNTRTVYAPAGQWVVRSMIAFPTAFTLKTDGPGRTIVVHRPTADGICLQFAAGADISYNNTVGGITIYSDDLLYTKVALELADVSSCAVDDLNIYGVGAGLANFYSGGAGSIGLRTKGREATGLRNLKIAADYPIYIAANPNQPATAGEDIDHFEGRNFYLIANGHYCITTQDGIGISNLTLSGYQAWVGGTGGFYMNDTRVAPVVTSRHLRFEGMRGEQCTDANGYWFNITCAQPAQTLSFVDCLGSATAQGIKINGVKQLLLDAVTMAASAGKDALRVTGATGGASISMRGCNWQPFSVVELTGYTPTAIEAYDATTSAAPATATYVNVRTGTEVNVAKVRATGLPGAIVGALGSTTGDVLQALSQAAGGGVTLRSTDNAEADFEPMALVFELLELWYRTGVGATALGATLDAAGTFTTKKAVASVAPTAVGHLVAATGGGDALQTIPNAAGDGASQRAVNAAQDDFTRLSQTFADLIWRYRTGVGTSAVAGGIGSTGRLSLLVVPTYADNAAATAGGLAVGDVYKTAVGDLMIRI